MKTGCYLLLYLIASFNGLAQNLKTKYVIVVVIDGPRYSETWGDTSKQYIQNIFRLSKDGVVADSFYNDRYTYTNAGHTAITTGHYQQIANDGTQLPDFPSFMQYYLKKKKLDSTKAFVVTSKDKLAILGNTSHKDWTKKFVPSTNCGKAGLKSGYRDDIDTYETILRIMETKQPHVMLINFKEPDDSAHEKDWKDYLNGIKNTDVLVYNLWQFIQSNPFYKDKTALFITNDHGRHLDGVENGFVGHGDLCEGCKHINFFALGPDFKSDYISNTYHNQTDLTATIAYILKLKMPYSKGKVMKEIFE